MVRALHSLSGRRRWNYVPELENITMYINGDNPSNGWVVLIFVIATPATIAGAGEQSPTILLKPPSSAARTPPRAKVYKINFDILLTLVSPP
jgi:hypothetical protein